MKREFKVGETVACYDSTERLVGCIKEVLHNNRVRLSFDDLSSTYIAHEKQLRHLVPTKRRELFAVFVTDGHLYSTHVDEQSAELMRKQFSDPVGAKIVRFVEAKEKRSKK